MLVAITKPSAARAERGEQSRQCAQGRELRDDRAAKLSAARTQRSHDRRLIEALVLRARDGGVEHDQPGEQREQEDELHGAAT